MIWIHMTYIKKDGEKWCTILIKYFVEMNKKVSCYYYGTFTVFSLSCTEYDGFEHNHFISS